MPSETTSKDRSPYAPPGARVADVDQLGRPPLEASAANLEREDFGGFWIRVLALSIDSAILYPLQYAISYVLLDLPTSPPVTPLQIALVDALISYVTLAAYEVAFWASPWQATIGKRICGLVVTSARFERLTLLHAAARFLAKLLSIFLLVGVLTTLLSSRRRALHDIMAQTLVVKRAALERASPISGTAP